MNCVWDGALALEMIKASIFKESHRNRTQSLKFLFNSGKREQLQTFKIESSKFG